MARLYPQFRTDEGRLRDDVLELYGELVVRPAGGARRFPVALFYSHATPYEKPIVVPLQAMPEFREGRADPTTVKASHLDHRHQMPNGALCLFQRETRADPSGDIVSGVDSLRRAERWFLGTLTGHWPPDSAESELEAHFYRINDILVSEAFYAPTLEGGHGKFFFVRDYRRLIDTQSGSPVECPMIMTALTIESVPVAQAIDARADLSRVYAWIRSETWDTTKIIRAAAPGSGPLDALEQGGWWSLPAEPRPFADGAGLLRELGTVVDDGDPWDTLWSQLTETYITTEWPVIGLRYPGRSGEPEWLMVTVPFGVRRDSGVPLIEADAVKRQRFASTPVSGVKVHSIRPTVLRMRNTGVVDAGVAGKTVALIGLGALGSAIAEMLAKAGVGRFRLCDSDRLATGNVVRHLVGVHEFGAAKVRVVESRLLEINPYLPFAEGDILCGSATQSLDALSAFIAPADLIIATTADEGVESLINHLAVLAGKPVLYARALRRGNVGRVFLVRPGRDACKACLASFAEARRGGGAFPVGWIDVPEGEDDILLHECGRPVIPASAVDLTFVAALAARVSLSALEGAGSEVNHWVWSQEALPDIDPRLAQPMTTVMGTLSPRADCPICSAPEVVDVVFGPGVRAAIVQQVEASIAAETGGILIGHVDERRRAVVMRATGPGPTAEQSASIFRRDVAFVQAELKRAQADLGGQGVYLGEWHSHLERDPMPSQTDIASLVGIAQAPNYLTRSPVMMIAGLDPADHRCATLKAWVFRVAGGMWPVKIRDVEHSQ